MNIGLLISELEDIDVKNICIGACQAAKDKEINLFILPGRYLYTDKSVNEDSPYDYQNSALFDYAMTTDFDALIIDIERIGKNAPILKKEAFLRKFEPVPVLTLTECEGFTNVNPVQSDHDQMQQLGYESVCDAIYFAKNKELPPSESQKQFNFVECSPAAAIEELANISSSLLHRKYASEKAYQTFAEDARKAGVKNCGIMLYDKKVRNTIKYSWERPEVISIKSALINGTITELKDDEVRIGTDKIISSFTKAGHNIFIMGDIFVGEYQLGLLIIEFKPVMLTDNFFECLLSVITGVSRVSYLEKELKRTNEELYEVQEELARDDSVLDHIGDQDYLTGGLNRRGFFAKAYDYLKEQFKPGSSAIVAYIHMESLKKINEMYGHEEGDRAVKRVAKILEEVFEGSIYGRIRGDEFAVIDITEDEGKGETFRQEMSTQNAILLSETSRYINHLQYSICEFGHEENLSLREMLKETDENLQRIKGNY